MDKNLLIYSGLIIAAFMWGSSLVVGKELLGNMNPILLVFARLSISSVIFLPLIKISSNNAKKLNKDVVLKLILLGFFGITLAFIFQYIGLSHTSATITSLIIMFDPLLITILSSIFLKESFRKKKIIGVLVAIFGSFILITNGNLNIYSHYNDLIGITFVILGELCWCSYVILGKKTLEKYSPMTVIGYSTVFGTIFLLPISLVFTSVSELSILPTYTWIWIFYLGIMGVFAHYFYFSGLKKFYASRVTMFEYLIPVFSIILASIFLKEIITIYIILGGLAIIVGINLVQRDW